MMNNMINSSTVPTPDQRDVDVVFNLINLAGDPSAAKARLVEVQAAVERAERQIAAHVERTRADLEAECARRRAECEERESAVAAREAQVRADAEVVTARKTDVERRARALLDMASAN